MRSLDETVAVRTQGKEDPGDAEKNFHYHLASPERGLLQNLCSNCPGNCGVNDGKSKTILREP